jgi:hypothetical protein
MPALTQRDEIDEESGLTGMNSAIKRLNHLRREFQHGGVAYELNMLAQGLNWIRWTMWPTPENQAALDAINKELLEHGPY